MLKKIFVLSCVLGVSATSLAAKTSGSQTGKGAFKGMGPIVNCSSEHEGEHTTLLIIPEVDLLAAAPDDEKPFTALRVQTTVYPADPVTHDEGQTIALADMGTAHYEKSSNSYVFRLEDEPDQKFPFGSDQKVTDSYDTKWTCEVAPLSAHSKK